MILHEDAFGEKNDDTNGDGGDVTLKKPLNGQNIQQKIRKASNIEPNILKHCNFKVEIGDTTIYELSEDEVIRLLKSFDSQPELRRYLLNNFCSNMQITSKCSSSN